MKSIDDRTKLAGANRLEVLLFSLGTNKNTGRNEVFGINVFKVREVLNKPAITQAPDMPPAVEGLVSLRGVMVPVVNVAKFCGMVLEKPPEVLIVTEYNKQTQALLVDSVEHILRMEWNDIKVPPPMLAHQFGGLLTAVTEIDDGRIVMILDVERVLAETDNFGNDIDDMKGIEKIDDDLTILYADDSSMARKQIEGTFNHLGIKFIGTRNGSEAWNVLLEHKERAKALNKPIFEFISGVLTDVEMPEMDGYVLTKKIKADPELCKLPVLMHSSLSAEANIQMGKSVGADVYVAKFSARELSESIRVLQKLCTERIAEINAEMEAK
ncbi:MAG TPA: chemotaxis protein CheV [Gammaproteobacteria bacterium]|nr:chemotaxis protein CheV [Gammaproteobacteria bacterium]